MKKNIKDILPLTPMQQGMLFHSLLNPELEVYTEQLSCRIKGNMNVNYFVKAWEKVFEKHDALRAGFMWDGLEEPLQIIFKTVEIPFEILDWKRLNEEDIHNRIDEIAKKERASGFDLNKAPLSKFKIIELSENEYYFIWSYHHILFDGWSTPIIFKDFLDNYDALLKNQELQITPVNSYRDFIAYLKNQNEVRQKKFWETYLEGFESPTKLPYSKFGEATQGYGKERRIFSDDISQKIHAFSKENNITLNTLFQASWAIVLSKYSSQNDILFGVTVSGRSADLDGISNIVGLFINTIPLRIKIDESKNIIDWLKQTQINFSELLQYEYTPLINIHKWSNIPGTEEMFKSILVVENYPIDESIKKSESELKIANLHSIEKTNFPLTLVAAPGKTIAFDLAYQTEYFKKESILRLLEELETTIKTFVNYPRKLLNRISILSNQENQLIKKWSSAEKPLPDNKLINKWFEKIADSYPENIALKYNIEILTYKELNIKANQLCNYLIDIGIQNEDVIGICIDKSFEMVIASLAVLKAGAAFVPLDPSYPKDRLNYIVEDGEIKIIITTGNNDNIFDNKKLSIISYNKKLDIIANYSASNPNIVISEHNLAYLIYTSGSTGKPKGVMLQHEGFCNLMTRMHEDFVVDKSSTILQFSSYSFDASIAEIFMPLLVGAELSIINKDIAISPDNLVDFINQNKITHATLPPSLLTLVDEDKIESDLTIISVGDACNWDTAKKFIKKVRFLNGYGPTEASVGTSWGEVNPEHESESITVPIGKPIGNSKMYLLDSNLNIVPIGGIGEIFIGGIGLARGYYNLPELTAEKFIPDPFSNINGARMYRTGDTARFLCDGTIEFIGRVDFQVKIRGFRIELGEIEAQLNSIKAIKNSVVNAVKDNNGNEKLIGFVISDKEGIDSDSIKKMLRKKLPEYMIPFTIVQLDEFPLTPNSKVDRKLLPKIEGIESIGVEDTLLNTNEEIISNIWMDILKLNHISIEQNFFDIGGHSLLATQVISRINESFNIQLPIKYIFDYPTVASFAKAIENYNGSEFESLPKISKVNREEKLPLSFSQKRLWFLNELKPNDPSYNITNAFKLTGKLNIDNLVKSINSVINRHEILRTVFIDEHGQPSQKILSKLNINIQFNDFTNIKDEDAEFNAKNIAMNEAQSVFNLKEGPLVKIVLIKLNENSNILIFTIHHIIADGWSIPIIIRDIASFYNAYENNSVIDLEELKIQYADYAAWQNMYLESSIYQKQLDYWKDQLAGIPPMLELPLDKPRPSVQTFNGSKLSFTINEDLTFALNKISRKEGVTLYMTMMMAFQLLLAKYSNQDDIVIGTPIAGRNKKELENLVGFFVNNLVIRTSFDNSKTFRQLLKNIRKTSLDAYLNQDLPFEKLVEELQPTRDLSHAPLFQVMFVFQNIPFSDIGISEIQLQPLEIETGTTTYDLSLTLSEAGNQISGTFEFNTDLFFESTIRKLIDHYILILNTITESIKAKISKLELVTETEKRKFIEEFNKTHVEFNDKITVHKTFEKYAEEYPENPALYFTDPLSNIRQRLTYAEINNSSNRLARYLISKGVSVEDKIGICLDRSFDLIISLLAVLKAGGAFLPIDPYYPDERIKYMVEDSDTKFVITSNNFVKKIPLTSNKIISIDNNTFMDLPSDNLNIEIDSDNLAYIIYTSGSTGLPKGTMLAHKGLCNLAIVQKKAFDISRESKILQFSSLSFDASVWEFVMAILNGASLQLTTKDIISSGDDLSKLLESEKITTITLPPSVLSVLQYNELSNLKTIITAGEPVSNELITKWKQGRKFFNAYGPTETTVCASMFLCDKTYPKGPPIGKPIDNFKLYILDQNLNLVPEGVPGELCIGGVGLARGYLNRPEVTADKFIPDIFSGQKGERLYRTGDLVRYLSDGNIEFLGRIDKQVKIRGFRIELPEIEYQLRKLNDFENVAVIVREDHPGEKYIAAYVVLKNNEELNIQIYKEKLAKVLPDYMIPSVIVNLNELPLTPNGKIDTKALPQPEFVNSDFSVKYVEPRNEIEQKLEDIAKEILHLEKVGVLNNFFSLGGHSLLATQYMSRIKETFQIDLQLRQLFETPTIEGLALAVNKALKEQNQKVETPSIKRVSRQSRMIDKSELS